MNDFYIVFASYFFLAGIDRLESKKYWSGILSILWSVALTSIWWNSYKELLRTG